MAAAPDAVARAGAAAARAAVSAAPAAWGRVRVVTLDATGTLLYHREPIAEVYCCSAAQAGAMPPAVDAMRLSFKAAFRNSLSRWPCFGHAEGLSAREWWQHTVRAAFVGAGAVYGEAEFARVFRRVYQHFGTPEGYRVFDDVKPFLEWASGRFCLGLLSNNVDRLVDNTLPLLGLHEHLRFYVLSHEAGVEKPGQEIFDRAREEAAAVLGGPVAPEEVLHVGDNHAADYCGARAAGLSAALIARDGVTQYQTWLDSPAWPGKEHEQVQEVSSLADVRRLLEEAAAVVPAARPARPG